MKNTAQPFISLQNIHKAFGSKKVLSGFNLDIEKGESVVIVGGSGSGKSVLLKTILGLLLPDSGHLMMDGVDMTRASSREREAMNSRIGMLFQNAALFDSLSIWENVAFGLISGFGMKRSAAKEIAIEKLAMVGLGADVAPLFPDELSGGMRKRVGLARAIAGDPEILLCDEPTTGLDPIMGHVIDNLIVESVQKLGATAISITHDMPSARRISTRMAMLYQGECIWNGATSNIDHCDNDYVTQFITGSAHGPIKMELRNPKR
ncbi:MAG: ABC transporter ATP-binding protein [Alphaproteobacteria bacterium]